MIRLDPDILHREILFAATGVASLALFLLARAWTREAERRGLPGSPATGSAKEAPVTLQPFFPAGTDWTGAIVRAAYLPRPTPAPAVWEITLFGARRVGALDSIQVDGMRCFELGADARDTERILAPLVRKLLARFEDDFSRKAPVRFQKPSTARTRALGTGPLLSWLSSERHIHHVCHWFLAEMHKVAREAGVPPSLEIRWDDELVLSVRMPYVRELAALPSLCRDNELVSVAILRDEVVVELWVAFSRDKAPTVLFPPTRVRESNREKRSAS